MFKTVNTTVSKTAKAKCRERIHGQDKVYRKTTQVTSSLHVFYTQCLFYQAML